MSFLKSDALTVVLWTGTYVNFRTTFYTYCLVWVQFRIGDLHKMLLSDWWNFVKIGREASPFLVDNNQVTFTHVWSIRVTFCRELNACTVNPYCILQGTERV